MTISSRSHIRSIAAATALGMVLASATIGASPALAEDPPTEGTPSVPTTPATPVSTIDFTAKGSITIHKKDLADGVPMVDPTGNENLTAPGIPLSGAEFELYEVDANLKTNAGFNAAALLVPGTAVFDDDAPFRSGKSGEAGELIFNDLPVGVYLLRETGAPAGFRPAPDSIVFIPMTDPKNTKAWNYKVHVYPKNSQNEVVKEVKDAGQNVGDSIVYTIKSDIPRVVQRENEFTTITKYEVRDDLDETRLAAPAIRVALSNDDTPWIVNADYTVAPFVEGLVDISFTPDGLAKLTEAKTKDPSAKVVTTLTSTVLAMGDTSVIVNDATTITNNGDGGGEVTTKSKTVKSYYGKLEVAKFEKGEGHTKKPLSGATFQLYVCTEQDTLAKLTGEALTVGGKSSWETGIDGPVGSIIINALHVTDFVNGVEIINPTQKYCLVETEAPDGYELLPNPIPISFTRADIAITEDGTNAVTLRANVENVKTVAPELPLTGGAGIGLLAALGGLIVGAGAWVARRTSRA